jgi:hypothetical protein
MNEDRYVDAAVRVVSPVTGMSSPAARDGLHLLGAGGAKRATDIRPHVGEVARWFAGPSAASTRRSLPVAPLRLELSPNGSQRTSPATGQVISGLLIGPSPLAHGQDVKRESR